MDNIIPNIKFYPDSPSSTRKGNGPPVKSPDNEQKYDFSNSLLTSATDDDMRLMDAAREGRVKLVKELLLLDSVNVNAVSIENGTALFYAALGKHSEVMEVLIANGARIDAVIRNGETALHNAAELNLTDMAALCIQHGADASIKNSDGKTPLDIAKEKKHTNLYVVLMNATLDKCITPVKKHVGLYEVKYDCIRGSDKKSIETERLYDMSQYAEFNATLSHPVVSSFIRLKEELYRAVTAIGTSYTIAYLMLTFFFHYSYVKCLSSSVKPNETVSYNHTDELLSHTNCYSLEEYQRIWIPMFVMALIMAIFEIFQFRILLWEYAKSTDNALDLFLIISSFICSPYWLIVDPSFYKMQKVLSIISMLVCSLSLMLFLFRDNIVIMMFRQVVLDVLKLFLRYSILLIGFMLVLHSLYVGTDGFEISENSIITSFVALSGGLDFTSKALTKGGQIYQDWSVNIVVLSFIILIMIVMLNLVTGIAVNISSEFLDQSKVFIIKEKIRSLYNMEIFVNMLPLKCIRLSIEPYSPVIMTNSELVDVKMWWYDRFIKHSKFRVSLFVSTHIHIRLCLSIFGQSCYCNCHIFATGTKIIGSCDGKLHVYDFMLNLSKEDMERIELREKKKEKEAKPDPIIAQLNVRMDQMDQKMNKMMYQTMDQMDQKMNKMMDQRMDQMDQKMNKMMFLLQELNSRL